MVETWHEDNDDKVDDQEVQARARELSLQAGRGKPLYAHPSPYCMTCLGLGIDPVTKVYCKCRYHRR